MSLRKTVLENIQLYPEMIHRWYHSYSILSIVAFPRKNLLIAGTQDSKVLVFDLLTYNLISTITLGTATETNTRSSVLCMCKSEDENYLFTAGADSLVRIWAFDDISRESMVKLVRMVEIATVYTATDIGDIFSIRYLDSFETIVFGCQNASLLYLDNVLQRIKLAQSNNMTNFEKLPHRRYDKFFDSKGPAGGVHKKLPMNATQSEKFVPPVKNKIASILEIPSENIITYAHNGFIYSIYSFKSGSHNGLENSRSSNECIITGGGDGLSRVWLFSKNEGNKIKIHLESEELDNEESVLSQTVEFPFLYCGLSDGYVKIWDLNTKQLVSTLHTPDKTDIFSLSTYKDHVFAINKIGITHFYENQCHHWNPNQGKILSSEIFERKSNNYNKTVSLLTGGNDGSLALWDLSHLAPYISSDRSGSFEHQYVRERSNSWNFTEPAFLNNEKMLETLREFISFQTVSQNIDTAQQLSSRRCATFLQQLFIKFGASQTQLLPVANGSNPVVVAHFTGNSDPLERKKILWYGHYDVISPGDFNLWDTNPFNLTCEDGYMKGRGVSDNKGPLIAAIYSAASLFQENKLLNDIVFVIEGNEETGSEGLKEVCIDYKDSIGPKIDWIFLSNSSWVDQTHPCLNYGLRGVINAELTIWCDGPDRHSGVDGGIHREPITDLINVISKLQDDHGKIAIPNFFSHLSDISQEEKERFQKVLELSNIDENLTLDDLIANWAEPSLSLTTMKTSGPGNITVIPKSTSIGISLRLVPEQTVESVKHKLVSFIEQNFSELQSNNNIRIDIVNEASAWLGDPNNQAYQILREELIAAWDLEPLFVREGGSIPCVRTLETIFSAPAVQIPCGQSTDNAHLDNENLRIKNWSKMAQILCKVFNRL